MELSKLDLWKQRIEDQQRSGLSISHWCKQNNVSDHAYYSWRKRIRENMESTNKIQPTFAEVNFNAKVSDTETGLHVSLDNLNITINNQEQARLAATFIQCLGILC